jgi:hypothetical protein
MADINKVSERLIEVAERFADVVDSAQGKGRRKSGAGAKWLILPAAGAGAYALVTSTSGLARKTRGLMNRAKDRATDLPDADLFGRVKEVAGAAETDRSGSNSGRTQAARRSQNRRSRNSQAQRRRKTSAS